MKLEHDTERRDGVTFVTATVYNPAPVTRHARVENRLEGTVLPPRRNGVPERGWDEAGVTLTVPAEKTVGIGYACSSPPSDPAVEIESTGRGPAPEDDAESRARRSLGTFRPPRMVVTEPAVSGDDDADQSPRDDRDSLAVDECGPESDGGHEPDDGTRIGSEERNDDVERATRRVALAAQLASAGVEDAAEVLEELVETDLVEGETDLVGDETNPVGGTGIAGARALERALEADVETLEGEASRLRSKADRLRRAANRAEENAAQAESRAEVARSVDLPLDALERFA
ncbi:hypothetical protein AArcSl_0023 [Halalkaliarchaeum desulfuricum]|uniref:Uncharacterized protein n=1 Tax=Halalkaliarchaeum desulfuricum TaxID=2055893 RepID=A0A343TF09_9EURY|nr:hypothetical protein [Halalkaliarchaeum desulfuricum]AUX07681.1 hypothetical protein AArcSl_0023 [Halalkaliarchaeum desulfuricum]